MFHTATEPSRQAVANSSPSLQVATPTTSWAWPHTSLTFVPSDQLTYQTHPLAQPATPYDIIIVFLHQRYKYIIHTCLASKVSLHIIHSHLNCVSKPAMHMHKISVNSLAFTTNKCFPIVFCSLVSCPGQMRERISQNPTAAGSPVTQTVLGLPSLSLSLPLLPPKTTELVIPTHCPLTAFHH